jgi:hypothetical protein
MSLGSKQSFEQRLNSPAHAPVYDCDDCDDCDRPFDDQRSLEQHLSSTAHVFKCEEWIDRLAANDLWSSISTLGSLGVYFDTIPLHTPPPAITQWITLFLVSPTKTTQSHASALWASN